MNHSNDDLTTAIKSQKDSLFNFPLDVIKFDAFIKELEEDQLTGIVEITAPQEEMRILLKKGKTLEMSHQ